jgi:uncharacterized membrane protein
MELSKRELKKELKRKRQCLYPIEPPKGKEGFLRELPYPQASPWETVLVQVAYIRKSVWALSVLLVLAAMAVVVSGKGMGEAVPFGNGAGQAAVPEYGLLAGGVGYGWLWSISAVMPALAVLAVMETFRSSAYGMAEMEMAARYSLPQVLLVRMLAIGAVDFGLALLGASLAVQGTGMGWLRAAVYLVVPWLCTCVLSLQAQKHRRGREAAWYGVICASVVSLAGAYGMGDREIIYGNQVFSLWLAAFVLFLLVWIRQMQGIWRKAEAWKGAGTWNLP